MIENNDSIIKHNDLNKKKENTKITLEINKSHNKNRVSQNLYSNTHKTDF